MAKIYVKPIRCRIIVTKLKWSYMNQSMAQRRATSSRGRLTACSTINMVTRPADGIAAAPTAAATAVNLWGKIWITWEINEKMLKIFNHLPDDFPRGLTEGPYIKLQVGQTVVLSICFCFAATILM